MAFESGKPRPKKAGRKKGTPNKASLTVEERAAALGVDPFRILLMFAAGDWKGLGYESEKIKSFGGEKYIIPPELRQRSASDVCDYLLPKRKAIDITNATPVDGLTISLNWGDDNEHNAEHAKADPTAKIVSRKH